MFFVIDYSDGGTDWIYGVSYMEALEYAEFYSAGIDFTISEYSSEADYLSSLG